MQFEKKIEILLS